MKLSGKYLLLLLLVLFVNAGWGQVFDLVVDAHGTGDYNNIQKAINSAPDNSSERTLIFVKNGTYYEKVLLPASKMNVSLIGQSADGVILTYDDNPQKGTSPADTYTLHADAAGFYAENITVENTSGNVGQAIAIRTTGDTMVFKNCRFLGFQDTYYAHKRRQYNLNCYVEGATDFIYGDATTVFDSCRINCVKGGSYITAPADTKLTTNIAGNIFLHGLLFRYCDVTADADVPDNSYYLGRPWQPNSSSVYIQCTLGDHIKSEGWSTWNDDNHLSSVFAEYQNITPGGSLVDVSQRVDWSSQLDSAIVANLYKLDFFFRKTFGEHWDPTRLTDNLSDPYGLSLNGNTLTWDAVDGAIGYVILKDDVVLGFADLESYTNEAVNGEISNFKVKSVTKNGALSTGKKSVETGVIVPAQNANLIRTYSKGIIKFEEPVTFRIYNVSGSLIRTGVGDEVDISNERSGVYIVKSSNKLGDLEIRKILK
ncbi:pectinesterase family protein [Maribellus mangrovi]|uniref:pectinesterase family protein n=1 Tax=Maribellus mangrovi TaxID=3133146 RepID=UPI0030EE9B4C